MSFWIPDPRWEEPNLLIPGKKPTGPVVIDWSHPLTKDLVSFVHVSDGIEDLVQSNPKPTIGTAGSIIVDKGRQSLNATGTEANAGLIPDDPWMDITTNITICGWYINRVSQASHYPCMWDKDRSACHTIALDYATTGPRAILNINSGRQDYQFTDADTTLDVWFFYAVTYNGTNVVGYQNGTILTSSNTETWTGQALGTNSLDLYLANSMTNQASGEDQSVDAVMTFARALSQQEIISLWRDTYQFLIPA